MGKYIFKFFFLKIGMVRHSEAVFVSFGGSILVVKKNTGIHSIMGKLCPAVLKKNNRG
jgi:hypothetical protein